MIAELAARATTISPLAYEFNNTFPWEVPEGTIIVEYDNGYWRVVSRGRPVTTFGSRCDALRYARQLAALYTPHYVIHERDEPGAEADRYGAVATLAIARRDYRRKLTSRPPSRLVSVRRLACA